MTTYRHNYSVRDSGRSSRLSTASSDSESATETTYSRTTNIDKYLKYKRNHSDDNYIYRQRKSSFSRPGSRQDIQTKMMDFLASMGSGKDPDGFVPRKKDEECLKCMLKIKHTKCESHKYIRIGGGYRHSYFYVKMLLEQIRLQKEREEMLRRRLEPISEGNTRAFKTYIRTKSGRLIEKIIYLSEDDYKKFMDEIQKGGDPLKILKNYLSKDEMNNLESYDKEEQQAIKTYVRTKSGRLVEKIIYVSKEEYEAMKRGDLDANDILRRRLGLKDGEKLEGWQESKMRTITTKIRTKSGRIIEKTIMISEEDYKKLQEGGNLNEILNKYMKSDPNATIVGWEKAQKPGMKVVKTYIRTKSGRIIEKTILMTEDEYKEFQKSNGDPNFLKKYLNLKEGETIDKWEKQSTVYEGSDDEVLNKAKAGQKIRDKDGNEYEVVVDPLTGKKYKRLINKANKKELLVYRTKDGRIITENDIKKRNDLKAGKRNADSESEFSYKSFISEGGTRHVRRKKKNADGTYAASESYHSSQDEEGKARRRDRRRKRKHGPNSAHSYYSVVSAGGTRHVRRKKKNADGTYGDSESYHSASSEEFKAAQKSIKEQKKKLKEKDNDSDNSFFSEVSAGGTRRHMKRKRIRDEHGNIIGYGKAEEHDGTGKTLKNKNKKGREHGSDSEFSYFSEVSVGGTHYKKRKKRLRDKDGKVIGHGKAEDYSSSEEELNKKKKKKRGGPNSAYSYYSEVSEGGTRIVKKRKRVRDKDGNIIGHEKSEVCSSSGESFITVSDGKGGKMKIKNPKKKGKKYSPVFSDATTDSDIVRERLKNMTEEEKEIYLRERAKRAEERESRRKEKYGENYEKMMDEYKKKKEVYQKKKKEAEDAQSLATNGSIRKRDGKQKKLDGNEADSEGEGDDYFSKNKKKQKREFERTASGNSVEIIRDKDGNIIKRIKKDKDGNIVEEEYDKEGNMIRRKIKKDNNSEEIVEEYDKDGKMISRKVKKKTGSDSEEDDGDYFEIGPDGKIRLKAGKKKIDLKNISKEMLLKLGIDPNLSKAEQLRLLKEKLGEDIEIVYGKKKIGLKNVNDYGSDANTTDLAEDSDVDIDTAKFGRRERIIEKRLGDKLHEFIKGLIEQSHLKDYQPATEKRSKIDFLSAYRLVDPNNLENYARYFAYEDSDNFDGLINYKGCVLALNNLKKCGIIHNLTDKQMDYVLAALDIEKHTDVSFRMFSVIAALGDRMTKLDSYCKDLLEIASLLDIERKLKLYRDLFYMNVRSDRDSNFIKMEGIVIDLKAGGLNDDQQKFIVSKLRPNEMREISFIDYLSYIPLFVSYHDNINANPLDMSDSKYSNSSKRRPSIQRDMVPLGHPLSRESMFYKKHYGSHKMSKYVTPLTDNNPDLNIVGKAKATINPYSLVPNINNKGSNS